MSQAERRRFDVGETKERVFERDGWSCVVCGNPVTADTGQLAHIIPQTKAMIHRYGRKVIHDDRNLMTTCSLTCNKRVDAGGQDVVMDELAQEIKEQN